MAFAIGAGAPGRAVGAVATGEMDSDRAVLAWREQDGSTPVTNLSGLCGHAHPWRRIADDAERGGDWVTPQIRLALGADPIKRIASETLKLADKAGLSTAREQRISVLFGRVQSLAVSGVSLGLREAEGQEPHAALTELLVEVGLAAIVQGNVVLIHLDEIQNITDARVLSQAFIALGDAITRKVEVEVPGIGLLERSLPIAVYLTGLPEFDDASGARKGATFTRRFKTTILAPIDDDDLRGALQRFVGPWLASSRWQRRRDDDPHGAESGPGHCRGMSG